MPGTLQMLVNAASSELTRVCCPHGISSAIEGEDAAVGSNCFLVPQPSLIIAPDSPFA